MKQNNTPLYVHKQSNHPPLILKNIPESINKRLSNNSKNETIFNESTNVYQQSLKNSGYKEKLKYMETKNQINTEKRRRNRNRNVTWFNPPYSNNVKTDVGKKFLSLLDRCFPQGNILNQIINRNTIKISYSCMPNIKQIISRHNKNIIKKNTPQETTRKCNCRNTNECPLNGECLTKNIVYQATVTDMSNNKETYVGITANSFKTRYTAHRASFRHQIKRNDTTLSQHIWELTDKNINYNIKWKILARKHPYNPASKTCHLCLEEKYTILFKDHKIASLNHRKEIFNTCRHRKKTPPKIPPTPGSTE